MGTIAWQRGKYIKFFAKMKIRVGGAAPIDVQKGDEFEYDGSILKYSGLEVTSPQLRGAIENGWATLDQDAIPEVEAIRPNRSIAKSKSVNKDLNKVQRTDAVPIETSSLDEDEVLKVTDRVSSDKSAPKILKSDDNRKSRGLSVSSDMESNQDAVAVGRVRTSARTVFNDVQNPSTARKIAELENMQNVRAELYKNKTVEKEGVQIKSNIGSVSDVIEHDSQEDNVVGTVRKSSVNTSEGISVKDTSTIRNTSKSTKSVVSKQAPPVKIADPRIRVARAICPDFPLNWDFTGKLAERLDRVRNHGTNQEFLEALYAAEGDQMRKVLVKEFPSVFEG